MQHRVPPEGWDHVTTQGFRPRDGLRRWTDWGRREFGGLQVRPSSPGAFTGKASRMTFGPAVLSVMSFSPAQAVNCLPDEGPEIDDALVFSLPRAGGFAYAGDGAAPVEVGVGDIYLRDLTRPWSAATRGESELITLRLPFDTFVSRLGDPQGLAGRVYSGHRPEVACVGGVIRSALALLETGPTPEQREILSRSVLDALELLTERDAAPTSPAALSLHRQALLHITSHLGDPELSASAVADALGVGPRSLQRAFQARGGTVQGTILDMRLARAARLLRDAGPRPSVTGLAMSLGFNDMAYFSRAFAAQYGEPPSRFGRSALH